MDRLTKIEMDLDKILGMLPASGNSSSDNQLAEKLEALKGQISQQTERIEQINTALSTFESSVEFDLKQLQNQCDGINTKIVNLEPTVENISTNIIPKLQKLEPAILSLQSEMNVMQSKVDNITDVIIPELENKINSSGGGGGGEENWVTLYDRSSPDEALNWGFPKGLRGGDMASDHLPDIFLYKKLKTYFVADSDRIINTFDIADLAERGTCNYKVLAQLSTLGYTVFSASLTIKITNGALARFSFPTIYKMTIANSKYPTVVSLNGSEFACFYKIEGLPF